MLTVATVDRKREQNTTAAGKSQLELLEALDELEELEELEQKI